MSDFRFIAGTAVLAVVAGLASGQCDTNPPFGAVIQNDPGTCGQATLAPDPNGGCNEDPIAYQDLGAINGGATITVAGNVGAFDAVDPATPVFPETRRCMPKSSSSSLSGPRRRRQRRGGWDAGAGG